MRNFNKILCVWLAAFTITCSGCGKEESSSKSESKADSSTTEVVSLSSGESSSLTEESHAGKYLTKLAEKLKQGEYTMKCTVTNSIYDGEVKLTRILSGENVYQIQEESIGSYGVISVDGKTYNFDNLAGMYQQTESEPPQSIIEEVINRNLPMAEDREEDTTDGIVTEQYTYTGDTYITNITFFFNEKNGDLEKYTLKYTIEGQDDMTETRNVDLLSFEADQSVFDLDFLDKMSDFGSMTEDERFDYCKDICSKNGITSDYLNEMDISEDDFKKIDFSTFLNLIYSI
ncbi:MAG: hypothetical protein K2F81_06880 [Ruminococcus sp.]|nr:hypothetical protein [Ruminococcus sp.]